MKKCLLVFCVIPVVLVLAGPANSAPITWSDNGHQYQIVMAEGISWTDARTAAQGLGSGWDLATITSSDEEAFIESILTLSSARDQYWLGGYQDPITSAPAENWHWVTGESWSYEKWGEGQPDDWDGGQYYLAMDSDKMSWGWDDNVGALYVIRGYIAESAAPVPEPATMLLLGAGLLGLAGFRKRFLKK